MLGLIDKSKQDLIWARDGSICKRCGECIDRRLNKKGAFFANGGIVITEGLPPMGVVHHKNRIRLNNDPTNLVLLCGKCHRRIHSIAKRVENRSKNYPSKDEIDDALKYVTFESEVKEE